MEEKVRAAMKRHGFGRFLIILILLFPKICFAWNSLWYYTHEALAYDAIHVLSQTEYPDLYKFEGNLKDGSESEGPHPGGEYNGGNVKRWWEDISLPSYIAFNYSDAYYKIGEIAHLTQDQAVPTHAANIFHPWYHHLDKFEGDADNHYVSNPSNGYISNSLPFDYYQPLQNYTRSKLSGWTKPSTGEQYWKPAPNAPADATGGDVTNPEAPWGAYGGTGDTDIYSWNDSPAIIGDQIYVATRYSAGVFEAASKKLPPLVKDLEIAPASDPIPLIDPQAGNTISFKILENRKKTVNIFITVDSPTGEPIISSDYGTGKAFDLSSGAELPWEGTYTINWDGKLANGNYPTSGQHDLHVRIEDDDGNTSDDTLHHKNIDHIPFPTVLIS